MSLQKYVPVKDRVCSNTMSRAPLKEQTTEISETDINCQVHSVKFRFPISTKKLKQL